MSRLSPQRLTEILQDLFLAYGASEHEAQEVAGHLVMSNLVGHDSHGVIRAPWYLDKIQNKEILPGVSITTERETSSSAIVDGHWGFGQTIAKFAMELAIKKAESANIAAVGVRQCNHVGRLGAYTSLAVQKGMVGIAMANLHGTSHCVAPYGAIEAKLPTNPISIAFPSGRIPDFLLDMTSSVVAEGKVKVKWTRNEKVPEGWIIDAEGNPSIAPSHFYDKPRGALLPLGGSVAGHKGFALSLAIDVLSGALSGAECSNPISRRHGNACFFIVIKIESFLPVQDFISKVGQLVGHVKSAKPAEGFDQVLIPGEPEHRQYQRRLEEGILLEKTICEQLRQKAEVVGLRIEEFEIKTATV